MLLTLPQRNLNLIQLSTMGTRKNLTLYQRILRARLLKLRSLKMRRMSAKNAHAKSIYNLRSEKNLNGKRFRDSPALDSIDGSDSDGESDHTKEMIDQISVELESEEIETRIEALKSLVHLLVDPSPNLKKFVLEGSCIEFLTKSLLSQEFEEKFQSAWCITNIAAGSPDLCKKALSVLPTLNTLLSSKEMQLKKQAAWAIGNMAADSSEFRLAIKANGSVPFLLKLLDEEDVELIKTACFALSNLSRYPNSISKQLIDLDIIKKLACLLENDQMNRAYPEIYWIIAYLTAETEEAGEKIIHSGMMGNIVKHMLGLSAIGNQCIPIVRIVGNLTSQGDCYSDIFLNNGTFLPVLFRYLVSDIRSVQKEALWALSNITAGQVSNVEITLDAGLLPIILPVALEGSFDIKKEAGYVIMNILAKGPNFIPVDDIKSLIPEFLSFLNSRDYEIAELGLQFFVAILRHFPVIIYLITSNA
ncbi:hypothetical protein DSO57_1033754 [Entomophthora muscae]|uniref:Uncharacterized protein n=1 Tax=Entomophthora muscae TaxID=34485 RepID=A0ACC2TME7_9FUNG|nr:hypothetical protein DSO57_1033754 [Entomophthora muscae]